jgi:hypothetical protein
VTVRALDAGAAAQFSRIHWDMRRSRELGRLVSDPLLRVGFDPDAGCWVLASVSRCRVHAESEPRDIAIPWKLLKDDAGEPYSIDDPRVRSCLLRSRVLTVDDAFRLLDARDAEEARDVASAEREARARCVDECEPVRRQIAESSGYIGREGEGGARRYFYDGCLRPVGAAA